MNLNASRDEKLKLVYDSIVDGLPFFPAYGLELTYDDAQYDAAKASWEARNPGAGVCREDVWVEIVSNGGDLIFTDAENDDEEVGRLNLANIDANWDKLWKLCPRAMAEYASENYDANDTDNIIQCLAFGDVIYG